MVPLFMGYGTLVLSFLRAKVVFVLLVSFGDFRFRGDSLMILEKESLV